MNANVFRSIVVFLLTILALVSTASAAPVESVDSSRATVALQKVDAFLSAQAVAQQLAALGVSPAQVRARLAQLDDAQLEQLAAQIDQLQAGGTIQGDNPHPWGPIGCFFRPLGRLLHDLYQLLFCWGKLSNG